MLPSSSQAALTNLYTFNDGTVSDSVGSQNGNAVNNVVFSGGMADLSSNIGQNGGAGNGAYINLPNGLATAAANGGTAGQFSFSVWFTVSENRGWAPVVSFGNSNGGEDAGDAGNNADYLQLIPFAGTGANPLRLTSHQAGNNTEGFVDTISAPVDTPLNVIGVFNQSGGLPGTLEMFVNGISVGSAAMANMDISSFTNVNNWLGRSQWNDSTFDGMFDEFAIYDTALTSLEAASVYAAGPTPVPEPSSLALAAGAAALGFRRRRKSN
ncbi:hypothetical protein Hsar01_01744 [Haloferula sargassicola]|uniref:Ice-binding protein C-terminal domain-containing protein n=2 Tax=Haloferula sargassicola TaxID=490096 RepID=A0ABP9UPA0_9BACT